MTSYQIACNPHDSLDPEGMADIVRSALMKEHYKPQIDDERVTTSRPIESRTLLDLFNRSVILTEYKGH